MTNRLSFGHNRVLRGTEFVCLDCGLHMGDIKVAANFRKLRKEPYFQTPEGRAGLEMAERRYPHDKAITPWMLREYRRGRFVVTPSWQADVQGLMHGEQNGSQEHVDYYNQRLNSDRPDIVFFHPPEGHQPGMMEPPLDEDGNPLQPDAIQPGMIQNLQKMIAWHGARNRGFDLMAHPYQDLLPKYNDWMQNYRERDPAAGEVVHPYPDGWTMRRVTDKDQIFDEGEEMRNCVPKYVEGVAKGTHHLFSLRDPKNNPHANVLMVPQQAGGHWDGGTVVDMREGANRTPRGDYQRYIRNWFDTFNQRPRAEFQPGPPGDPGPGDPADYGLEARYGKMMGWEDVPELWRTVTGARMDMLRNPDASKHLQTPEAQEFLDWLQHSSGLYNDKTDYIMPLLVKEWAAGRLTKEPYEGLVRPGNPEELAQKQQEVLADFERAYGQREIERNPIQYQEIAERRARESLNEPISLDDLESTTDFLRSKHPLTKGITNLNSRDLTWDDIQRPKKEWDSIQRVKNDKADIVHKGPNGSYIKRLRPDELVWEGTQMGNCIKEYDYQDKVRHKNTALYSIRDKSGNPHIDMEITPKHFRNSETGEVKTTHQIYQDGGDIMDEAWKPIPQEGKIIQIQGKGNKPPHGKYAPLVKDWMGSKHFVGDNGEDYRPQWELGNTHFQHMNQLFNPQAEHIIYYHPGDYGIEEPKLDTDYKGLTQTLHQELASDPEHKRIPYLVDWAHRQGELDDLQKAAHDPDLEKAYKASLGRGAMADYRTDPEYQAWERENPEPEPYPPFEEPFECDSDYCAGARRRVQRNYDGNYQCNYCGNRAPEDAAQAADAARNQWSEGYNQWVENTETPWYEGRSKAINDARARAGEVAWGNSKEREMLNTLKEQIEAAQQGQPIAVHQGRFACTCGHHTARWVDVTDTFIKLANEFNKLRNQLRKSDILDTKNTRILDHLRYAFPNHGKLADWLHREIRKGRLTSPAADHDEQIEGLRANIGRYEQNAREYPDDTAYYQRHIEDAERQIALREEQINDPEWLARQNLSHYDPNTGVHTDIDKDFLDEVQSVLTKRKQRKEPANLNELSMGDLLQDVKDERMAKKARNSGSVVHKFPNKWTIRHLDTAEDANIESEMLGHCINQYGSKIERGESHNYSLRDPKGLAHITLEIKHTRPEQVNWNRLRESANDLNFECPSCGGEVVRGKCANCGFNIDDMEKWHGGDRTEKDAIKQKILEQYQKPGEKPKHQDLLYPNGDPRNDACTHCGSRAKAFENENPEVYPNRWYCANCGQYYDMSRPYDQWPEEMQEETDNYRYIYTNRGEDEIYQRRRNGEREAPDPRDPQNWWDKLQPQMRDLGLMRPDLRDGDAYQIQGKENVAPHSKYHGYIQDWMRSIPYDERPKATWSSYYTKTPVLHADDLHLGGKRGEDDFGFRYPDREYNWSSILNSMHGHAKEWSPGRGTGKQFMEETNPDTRNNDSGRVYNYNPEIGNYVYQFAKDHDQLEDMFKALAPWGQPTSMPFPNLGTVTCPECKTPGFLHRDLRDPTKAQCANCGAMQDAQELEKLLPPTMQPKMPPPSYTPYQAAAMQHLGPKLANHPELMKDELFPTPAPGINYRGGQPGRCRSCNAEGAIGVAFTRERAEREGYTDAAGYNDYLGCVACGRVSLPNQLTDQYQAYHVARVASVHDNPQIHVGVYGGPCGCAWGQREENDEILQKRGSYQARIHRKLADKFNDFLMSPKARPDLQDPKAQEFLALLKNNYLNENTDELMPWLVREWKKGRVAPSQTPTYDPGGRFTMDLGDEYPNPLQTTLGNHHKISPDQLNLWSEWYHSNHPTRQGVDMMQLTSPEFHQKIKDWEAAKLAEGEDAAHARGKVEHEFHDGWTVQKLHSERQLKDEGQKMGHCVGGYWPVVNLGSKIIYSLRDKANEPHMTWEVTPGQWNCKNCGADNWPGNDNRTCHDCGGENEPSQIGGKIGQIYGKQNRPSQDAYAARVKEYYESKLPNVGDRPTKASHEYGISTAQDLLEFDPTSETDEKTGHEIDRYGIPLSSETPRIHWPDIAYDMIAGAETVNPDVIAKAAEMGELDDLERGVEEFQEEQQHEVTYDAKYEAENDPEYTLPTYNPPEEPDSDDYTETCETCNGDGTTKDEDGNEEECEDCYGAGEVPDEIGYEHAVDNWHADKDEYIRDAVEQYVEDCWDDHPYNTLSNDALYEIHRYKAQQRQGQPVQASVKKVARPRPHKNWTTGEDCECPFISHLKPDLRFRATKIQRCEVCGDPLNDGLKCSRCDWGGGPISQDPTGNPSDPTQALKPAIQARIIASLSKEQKAAIWDKSNDQLNPAEKIYVESMKRFAEFEINDDYVRKALQDVGINDAPPGGVIFNMAWDIIDTMRSNYDQLGSADIATEVADQAVPDTTQKIMEAAQEEPSFMHTPSHHDLVGAPAEQIRQHLYALAEDLAHRELYSIQAEAQQAQQIVQPA